LTDDTYVQAMFDVYQKYVRAHFEQWFFLQEVHENMPEHA
jgi:lauroyl/myristoyl acyltransferase